MDAYMNQNKVRQNETTFIFCGMFYVSRLYSIGISTCKSNPTEITFPNRWIWGHQIVVDCTYDLVARFRPEPAADLSISMMLYRMNSGSWPVKGGDCLLPRKSA